MKPPRLKQNRKEKLGINTGNWSIPQPQPFGNKNRSPKLYLGVNLFLGN